jgi:imidazolonepropionase-like amidohydrolase
VKRLWAAAFFTAFFAAAWSSAQTVRNSGLEAKRQIVAIVGAKAYLLPGGPPIENATIIIANGRIEAAVAGIAAPPGARIIDAHGKIVTPGLMNSDSQLGLVESGTADTTDSAASSGPFGAAFDVKYAVNPNSTLLPVARADGLTRAMVLPTGSATPPFRGLGAVLRLSEGPDILDRGQAAVVAEVGGMTAPKAGGSRSAQWMLIRMALTAARRPVAPAATVKERAAQKDDEKAGALLTSTNLAPLRLVLERRIPLVIIASRESDLRQAVSIADDYNVRIVLVGADEAWRVADLLASHKIAVVLNPFASTPETYDQIGARLDNAAILDRAGVAVSFLATFVHVNHNAGLAIREGAGVAVANGLPWSHALKALTLNPAETWGIADHYGTLMPGKDADLVVWDGDPLEPRSAPENMFVRGEEVSLKTRQTELEQRYAPRNAGAPLPPGYR